MNNELKPVKGPVINHNSNVAAQVPVGNFLNPDKDLSKQSKYSPDQVNSLHFRSDLDKSSFAQHHTLGIKHSQASPGDHDHTGYTSRKLGHGLGLSISGSKGGNAALTSLISLLSNFIEFTDGTS